MPRLIPSDSVMGCVNSVVWRFSIGETTQLESIFFLTEQERMMQLMKLVTSVARRDEIVKKILSKPGVLDGLKKMVISRQNEDGAKEIVQSTRGHSENI